jgi:hypothetical protein
MIDKALIMIMFMYALSFSLYAGQYMLADPYGITLTTIPTPDSPNGVPIKLHLKAFIDEGAFNQRTANISEGNFTSNSTYYDRVETFTTAAAFVGWELVQLLTGTYVFQILVLFGVPDLFVTMIIALYTLLLARAIIGYIRGI